MKEKYINTLGKKENADGENARQKKRYLFLLICFGVASAAFVTNHKPT
jgi:hypothetical protein